jgi:hypothetical protein
MSTEWRWQGKDAFSVSSCPPQMWNGLAWAWTRTSTVTDGDWPPEPGTAGRVRSRTLSMGRSNRLESLMMMMMMTTSVHNGGGVMTDGVRTSEEVGWYIRDGPVCAAGWPCADNGNTEEDPDNCKTTSRKRMSQTTRAVVPNLR